MSVGRRQVAEFLIKARDPIDPPADQKQRDRGYKMGDIVVVMPDGHEWGREERLPKFVVVKVVGMSVDFARKYVETYETNTGLTNPVGIPIKKLVAVRKYNVLINNISKHIKNKLLAEGEITIAWDNIKSCVYNKLSMMTE